MAFYFKDKLIAPNAKPTPENADLLGTDSTSAFVKVDLPAPADLLGTKLESDGVKTFVSKTVPKSAFVLGTNANGNFAARTVPSADVLGFSSSTSAFTAKTAPASAYLVGTDANKNFVERDLPANATVLGTDEDGKFIDSAVLPSGQEGDVYYLQPNAQPKQQQIMNCAVYVCESTEDINACLSQVLDFSEVFESWNRGALTRESNKWKQWGFDSDYPKQNLGGIMAEIANAKANWELSCAQNPSQGNPLSDLTWSGYISSDNEQQLVRWIKHINKRPGSDGSNLYDLSVGKPKDKPQVDNFYWDNQNTAWRTFDADYGYGYWAYNKSLSTIMQLKNTLDTSYFYSPYEYDKYHVKMLLKSVIDDDDYIGFVPAVGENAKEGGRQDPLYVVRRSDIAVNSSANHKALGGVTNWYITHGVLPTFNTPRDMLTWYKLGSAISSLHPDALPYLSALSSAISSSEDPEGWALAAEGLDPSQISNRVLLIYTAYARNSDIQYAKDYVNGEGYEYETAKDWDEMPNGIVVDVTRIGNGLSAKTLRNDDDQSSVSLRYQLSLDLGSPELSSWAGRRPIGFYAHSQPGTAFQILEFDVPKIIVDTRDNTVKEYYKAPGASEYAVTDLEDFGPTYVGVGRLTRNTATKKTFYVGQTSFMRVVDDNMAQRIADLEQRVAALGG